MNTFKLIDSSFDEFFNKKYIYHLSNGDKIDLIFRKKHIPHLIGIHKFKDHIPLIDSYLNKANYKVTADNVIAKLIADSIEVSNLDKLLPTTLWNNRAKDRIEYFTPDNIHSLLTNAKTFHFDITSSKNKKGKYATFRVIGIDHLHLVYAKDHAKPQEPYFLNSFFVIQNKDPRLAKQVSVDKLEIYELQDSDYVLVDVIDHLAIRNLINTLKKDVKEYTKVNNLVYYDPSKTEYLDRIHDLFFRIKENASELKKLSGHEDALSRKDVSIVYALLKDGNLL